MRTILIGTILVLTCSLAMGQINFVAGYRASFLPETNELNKIIGEFSENSSADTSTVNLQRTIINRFYDEKNDGDIGFGQVTYLNGVDVGLYYRLDNVILEASWKTKRRRVDATYRTEEIRAVKEVTDTTSENFGEFVESGRQRQDSEHSITTRIRTASVGVQYVAGFVGIGATLDYNWLRVGGDFEGIQGPDEIKDSSFGTHLSLSFHFGNSGVVGLTLQPYAQLNFKDYQFSDDRSGKLNSFGVALIVRNGPQRPW